MLKKVYSFACITISSLFFHVKNCPCEEQPQEMKLVIIQIIDSESESAEVVTSSWLFIRLMTSPSMRIFMG